MLWCLMKEQELLLAEVIVKLTAMERLLTRSKVINSEELISEMKKISEEVLKLVMENSKKN